MGKYRKPPPPPGGGGGGGPAKKYASKRRTVHEGGKKYASMDSEGAAATKQAAQSAVTGALGAVAGGTRRAKIAAKLAVKTAKKFKGSEGGEGEQEQQAPPPPEPEGDSDDLPPWQGRGSSNGLTVAEARQLLASSRQSEDRMIGIYGQEDEVVAWAEAEGWEVTGQVRENAVSGAKPLVLRRDVVRALWDCEDGKAEGLAWYSQDRMARDVETVEQLRTACRYMGKKLYSVELDRDIAQDETAMERWERIKLDYEAMAHVYASQEQLQKGRIAKRDRGGHVGGNPFHRKFGFEKVELNGRTENRPVRAEQEWISYVRERRQSGATYPAIAGELNERGVRTTTGGLWTKKTVRDLVVQPGRTPRIEGLEGTVTRVAVPDQQRRTA